VSGAINPRHRRVLDTYVQHMEIDTPTIDREGGLTAATEVERLVSDRTAAVIVQQPNFFGCIEDMGPIAAAAHKHGALLIAIVDPISLGLIAPPGSYGADIAVGEGQALGCPMGAGGPLLGLFACKEQFVRRLPGRVVGETKDIDGKRAFVMTLRTREQDIRRERATSNICTNEALYALAATVYLATMGKAGLRQIAELCVHKAHYAAERLAGIPGFGLAFPAAPFVKEFVTFAPRDPEQINRHLQKAGVTGGLPLGRHFPELKNAMLWCVTEKRTRAEIDHLANALCEM
jgi:glycine dehydrogenase subunit 1